jgi:hypothetical protein
MITRKKLKLLKDGIETVREWFLFVDKRTNVDARIFKKLNTATTELDITQSEAQIIMRWFLLVPDITKGKIDELAYKMLENFIKHEKDGE